MSPVLREDDSTKLEHQLKPDALKTDSEKLRHDAKDTLDNAASHLPGQSLARDHIDTGAANPHHHGHDAGRGDLGTTGDALKPSGEQTIGEKAKVEADKAASHIQPNDQKSTGQDLKDAVTPGHDSSLTPHDHTTSTVHTAHGENHGLGEKLEELKDKIVGAVSGGSHGAKQDPHHEAHRA